MDSSSLPKSSLRRTKHKQQPVYDQDDFDDEYFAMTYRPLSNLPTPPPSSKNSSAALSPVVEMHQGEQLEPTFLGAAIHLVNLLPPRASLATPSVPLVQAMLSRADLPLHTIALAVCIMDSLNTRFSRAWRLSCPLVAQAPDSDMEDNHYTHTAPSSPGRSQRREQQQQRQQHIDSVYPELIVLAALVIAAKFTIDSCEPTRWYASAWGRGLWTCEQINATERCLMDNIGYRIMPLTATDLLQDALDDMARAAKSVLALSVRCDGDVRMSSPSSSPLSSSSSTCSPGGHGWDSPITPASSHDGEDLRFRTRGFEKPAASPLSLELTSTDAN